MQAESEKKMQTLSRLFSIPAARIHTRVVFGNVRDEILAIGNADEFDVIVVGSRTPGLSTHLLRFERRIYPALRKNTGAGCPLAYLSIRAAVLLLIWLPPESFTLH
jgi:hypothetical protein